jgi:hypothetical protein
VRGDQGRLFFPGPRRQVSGGGKRFQRLLIRVDKSLQFRAHVRDIVPARIQLLPDLIQIRRESHQDALK